MNACDIFPLLSLPTFQPLLPSCGMCFFVYLFNFLGIWKANIPVSCLHEPIGFPMIFDLTIISKLGFIPFRSGRRTPKAVANGEAKDELPENALINVLGCCQKR